MCVHACVLNDLMPVITSYHTISDKFMTDHSAIMRHICARCTCWTRFAFHSHSHYAFSGNVSQLNIHEPSELLDSLQAAALQYPQLFTQLARLSVQVRLLEEAVNSGDVSSTHACMHTHAHTHTHTHTHTPHAHTHAHMHARTHAHIHTHLH